MLALLVDPQIVLDALGDVVNTHYTVNNDFWGYVHWVGANIIKNVKGIDANTHVIKIKSKFIVTPLAELASNEARKVQ